MSNKPIDFLKKKDNVELLRVVGQIIVFIVIIILILFFCLLISPKLYNTTTLLQTVCILIGLLIVLVVSGGIEISIGDLFKVKKDTEEIKKELVGLRILFKATQNQSNSPTFIVSQTSGNEDVVTKYYQPDEEPLDIEDADENVFDNTSATSNNIKLK